MVVPVVQSPDTTVMGTAETGCLACHRNARPSQKHCLCKENGSLQGSFNALGLSVGSCVCVCVCVREEEV